MRQNLREIFTELIASSQEQELRGGSKRDLELIALADKVTVCVGVRRCGKSTLMQQQFQKLAAQGIPRENMLMINFADERLADMGSSGWNELFEAYYSMYPHKRGKEKVYFCFDEIQMHPHWELFVERLRREENCEIYITGSSAATFKSEPDINFSPKFVAEEDRVHALVPFNWNLEAGDYALTFSYGGSTQQINIKLGERSNAFLDRTLEMNDSIVKNFGSEDQRTAAETELREIAKNYGTKRYWENGETLFYDDSDLTFALGFGHTYTVSGTDIKFRNTGVDFRVDAGTEICANLGGEVVYAGILDYSGYIVVIEHGYGLKSWYAHMGSTTVKVGDVVKKGDAVGTAGESGFTSVEGVHIGMTIYDVPVCTYAIWKNSYRPEGQKGIVMYEVKDN